jgi:hypothetical protein
MLHFGVADLSGNPRGAAYDKTAWRDLLAFGDERSGPNDAIVANFRPIEDDGPHADKATVSDSASMDDGSMTYRHVIPDDARQIRGYMKDCPILDIRTISYLDGSKVPAKRDIMPN